LPARRAAIAAKHHRVVERPEIVLRPERSLRALALPVDLAVPDRVATRPGIFPSIDPAGVLPELCRSGSVAVVARAAIASAAVQQWRHAFTPSENYVTKLADRVLDSNSFYELEMSHALQNRLKK
jgi:hypothetical protein